ncbi:MAG: heme lyase CcmF/NrfE family subunit [Deltaproteobacteria bacterium]|nr:heme lyase CcmF/NrfE family subunit [Deltaproteobacteria bacterium]
MHVVAFACLLLALVVASFGGLAAAWSFKTGSPGFDRRARMAQAAVAGFILVACAILFRALMVRDFSYEYVHGYTDTFLPFFYLVTAFWAGQSGSFLFWTAAIAVMGVFVAMGSGLDRAPVRVKAAFWLFFFLAQALFLLILTGPSNPFLRLSPVPLQGNGMNPLLQNPGMIFHPPLLFIGYAGFTIPCCLAAAFSLGGRSNDWISVGRNWILISWIFLTAGIILGAWWSYMELGWGGYWAWDPVENASLVPWLAGTALVHTAVVGRAKGALGKTNVFLAGLTFLMCIFATFVVRSGFIDSLHAFGGGGVATPLLASMALILLLILAVTFAKSEGPGPSIGDLASRQGMMLVAAWIFLALGGIVVLGILWPNISSLWSASPMGLDAKFYNRVCLPPFVLLSLLLAFCPWFSWRDGLTSRRGALVSAAVLVLCLAGLWWMGIRIPLALVGAAAGLTVVFSSLAVFFVDHSARSSRKLWGALGVHLGLGLVVLGIAISGPYKAEKEVILTKGGTVDIGSFSILYRSFDDRETESMALVEAELLVAKGDRPVGILKPQKRLYRNFDQSFAEVSVIPSLGDEIYATLLAFDQDLNVSLKLSLNPLVNWIWIGGTIMCLAGFIGLGRTRRNGGGGEGDRS